MASSQLLWLISLSKMAKLKQSINTWQAACAAPSAPLNRCDENRIGSAWFPSCPARGRKDPIRCHAPSGSQISGVDCVDIYWYDIFKYYLIIRLLGDWHMPPFSQTCNSAHDFVTADSSCDSGTELQFHNCHAEFIPPRKNGLGEWHEQHMLSGQAKLNRSESYRIKTPARWENTLTDADRIMIDSWRNS